MSHKKNTKKNSQPDVPAYPHDGSEVVGAARPVGGRGYLCTRGNCGQDIGHHENQDAHNAQVHFGSNSAAGVYGRQGLPVSSNDSSGYGPR